MSILCKLLKSVGGNSLANFLYVGISRELEFNLSDARQIELKLCVHIEKSRSFQGISAYLAVGYRGVILLLACKALNVDGYYALIGENDTVACASVRTNDYLALYKKVVYDFSKIIVLYLFESGKNALAVKINHFISPFC